MTSASSILIWASSLETILLCIHKKSKHKLMERPHHPRYEFNHVFPLHMPSVPFFDANFFNAQWAHQGVHHQFATAIVRIRIQNIFAFPGLRHGELSRCQDVSESGALSGIFVDDCTHSREQTRMQYFVWERILYSPNTSRCLCLDYPRKGAGRLLGYSVLTSIRFWKVQLKVSFNLKLTRFPRVVLSVGNVVPWIWAFTW